MIKDLENLKHFLKINVVCNDIGIVIGQRKYTLNIL